MRTCQKIVQMPSPRQAVFCESVADTNTHFFRYHGWPKSQQEYLMVVQNLKLDRWMQVYVWQVSLRSILWDSVTEVLPAVPNLFSNIGYIPPNAQLFSKPAALYIFENNDAVFEQINKDEAWWDTYQGLIELIWIGSMTPSTWTQRLRSNASTQPNNWQTQTKETFTGDRWAQLLTLFIQSDVTQQFHSQCCGCTSSFSFFFRDVKAKRNFPWSNHQREE